LRGILPAATQLGSGGMGEVWRARRSDGAYEGRAAVKVLKRGMDSHAVLQRFAQERQALARLNHPHIARLLDAGLSDEGLPYFVMELVDGRPSTSRAGSAAGAAAGALPATGRRRGLRAPQPAGAPRPQARQRAGGRAKARSSCWTSASPRRWTRWRPTRRRRATLGGQRPFTPHYASPEQVRGEPVSTATDIYSLGVLLYQMLTGQRALPAAGATTPMRRHAACWKKNPRAPAA
jgi:hypothetical protein